MNRGEAGSRQGQGSGGGGASGAGRSGQTPSRLGRGSKLRASLGGLPARETQKHQPCVSWAWGAKDIPSAPQHSQPEAATVNSFARQLPPFLRHRLSPGGSGEGAGEGPHSHFPWGRAEPAGSPSPAARMGVPTGVGAGSPNSWGPAGRCGPSLGELSKFDSPKFRWFSSETWWGRNSTLKQWVAG